MHAGKSDEAALKKFSSACAVKDVDSKIRQLQQCLKLVCFDIS